MSYFQVCQLIKMCFVVVVTVISIHQGYGQPVSALQTRSSLLGAQRSSSISTRTKLFSKTLMFLQIAQDGRVSGTLDCNSQYVQLVLSSVGSGLVSIKSSQTGRYLAMNSTGNLYSLPQKSNESVFKNVVESSGYHTFSSYTYFQRVLYDTFVAIRTNGRTKNGKRTNRNQKPAQFLMIQNTQC